MILNTIWFLCNGAMSRSLLYLPLPLSCLWCVHACLAGLSLDSVLVLCSFTCASYWPMFSFLERMSSYGILTFLLALYQRYIINRKYWFMLIIWILYRIFFCDIFSLISKIFMQTSNFFSHLKSSLRFFWLYCSLLMHSSVSLCYFPAFF